ncbi:helix-turn-helix domain-containing protein [Pseudonocardia halophobica]|uniref:helix-turn-helix domain-containing protein n=1 Tax=Pseudonocardia halophobica TaxID=29401 RepID=UPI003D9009AC
MPSPTPSPEWINEHGLIPHAEAARILGITPRWLNKWIADGTIRCVQHGALRLIQRTELDDYVGRLVAEGEERRERAARARRKASTTRRRASSRG